MIYRFCFLVVLVSGCTTFKARQFWSKCPNGMALVESESKHVKLCVDEYELTLGNKLPRTLFPIANVSYYDCQKLCLAFGKRLLTNDEWLLACEGTPVEKCNVFRPHPIIAKLTAKSPWQFAGSDCKNSKNTWAAACMEDESINNNADGLAIGGDFPGCVSSRGVFQMVGNLGEWVDPTFMMKNTLHGRFNGGLYPQRKSSCSYTTIAHSPRYRDYSLGCRCGKSLPK